MDIFGDEIYVVRDAKLPQTMQDLGDKLSMIKGTSKHAKLPKINAQFTITNADQSTIGKFDWTMEFGHIHSRADDELFKAEVNT